jgi:hypothetical protein
MAGLNLIQHYPRLNEFTSKVLGHPEKARVNGKRRSSGASPDSLL